MNLFQGWGLMALALGGVLGFLRVTQPAQGGPLFTIPANGGTIAVVLPPDWVLLTLVIGGLVMIVIGTLWNVIRFGRRDADENVRKE